MSRKNCTLWNEVISYGPNYLVKPFALGRLSGLPVTVEMWMRMCLNWFSFRSSEGTLPWGLSFNDLLTVFYRVQWYSNEHSTTIWLIRLECQTQSQSIIGIDWSHGWWHWLVFDAFMHIHFPYMPINTFHIWHLHLIWLTYLFWHTLAITCEVDVAVVEYSAHFNDVSAALYNNIFTKVTCYAS